MAFKDSNGAIQYYMCGLPYRNDRVFVIDFTKQIERSLKDSLVRVPEHDVDWSHIETK